LSPLKFNGKQWNYMAIFMMPLALLTGWFLARRGRLLELGLGVTMVLAGLVFCAREQWEWRAMTANGRLVADFAESHAAIPVYGPLEAQRQSTLARLLRGSLDPSADVRPLSELGSLKTTDGADAAVRAYVVRDPAMWNGADYEGGIADIPAALPRCWTLAQTLAAPSLGFGSFIAGPGALVASRLPQRIADQIGFGREEPFYREKSADIYAVSAGCLRNMAPAAHGPRS
jgi:hypothetical protein